HRSGGSRQQYPYIAQLLVLAIEGHAWQRHQMVAVRRKQHAGPCGYGCLEGELARDPKFARSRGGPVPYRIGKMRWTSAKCRLNCRAARVHFDARQPLGDLGQHDVIDSVGANRHQGIGRKRFELLPAHAELITERRNVNVIALTKRAYDSAPLVFGCQVAQPAIEPIKPLALLRDTGAAESVLPPIHRKDDLLVARHYRLEYQPPQFAQPIGKAG